MTSITTLGKLGGYWEVPSCLDPLGGLGKKTSQEVVVRKEP